MPDTTSPEAGPPETADRFVHQAVAGLWPGSSIVAVTAVPGDASSRRYLRYRISDAAEAPQTVVAMVMEDAAIALSSEELSVFGDDGPTELAFSNVARFLNPRTDTIPRIYAASEDSTVLLLEDVGDTPLWDAATAPGADTEAFFKTALETLAELQEVAVDDGSGCFAFQQAFDEQLFSWEFKHFLDYGVAGAAPELIEAASTELNSLAQELGRLPRVFCHRDYHAWNIHWHEGRIRIFDFQDALLAPAVYDVASLLTDRITPERVDPEMEARLVEHYYENQRVGRLESLEATRTAYSHCALQRALKVIGRFNYLADEKGKFGYAKMLPTVVRGARRLVGATEGLDATKTLLDDYARDGAPV